jgi:class 3 adenylate cyclase
MNGMTNQEGFVHETTELTFQRLKIIAGLATAIFAIFIGFRFYLAPEDVESTLGIRLGICIANFIFLAVIHFRLFPGPRAANWIALGLHLTWVFYLEALIVVGDSLEPRQFHALVLVMPCWAMLVPMQGRQCVWLAALSVIGHWVGFTMADHLTDTVQLADELAMICAIGIVSVIGASMTNRLRRANYWARLEIEQERQRSETLLKNMLPEPIAKRLKNAERGIADAFDNVSILFADVCNFTELSTELSPSDLVKFLNGFFSMADELADKHDLEKIKTIGDAYMVAAGLPHAREDHEAAIARFAIQLRDAFEKMEHPHGHKLQLRIGLNSGPVVAGVIGQTKFAYDLWGDTVNVAARMESAGAPGVIQLPEGMALRIEDRFEVRRLREEHIKGKGLMNIWMLVRERVPGA